MSILERIFKIIMNKESTKENLEKSLDELQIVKNGLVKYGNMACNANARKQYSNAEKGEKIIKRIISDREKTKRKEDLSEWENKFEESKKTSTKLSAELDAARLKLKKQLNNINK